MRVEGGLLYKLLVGWNTMSGWVGPAYPNATGRQPLPNLGRRYPPPRFGTWAFDCGVGGCLYELTADPTEHHDLAASMPAVTKRMRARLDELNQRLYSPDRGKGDPAACQVAEERFGGFYGPFVGPLP